MKVTKEENRVEQIGHERNTLNNLEVSISDALGSFRGRFPFSGERYEESRGEGDIRG
jgi:hypothetical protein